MPGAKLYNKWHLDGMNVTRSPTPREKKPGRRGGGGPEAQQTSGDARWEITKHGGRFLRGIGSCMLLYVVPTVVQLCSSHSIQVVVDYRSCLASVSQFIIFLSSFISISFSVVIQSSVQYTNNNVTFVSKILNLLILGPKCLAYSFG